MISIRDEDKQELEEVADLLHGDVNGSDILFAQLKVKIVLKHIHELSHQAPVIEPRIVSMSEAEKRICYPERYASRKADQA